MRPPFAIGLLLLLFGFGRLLFVVQLLLLLVGNVPTVDLTPEQYKIHFFRSPEGKWLSLLNLRVVFQTPEVPDVEEDVTEVLPDFDDYDDWTVITLEPFRVRPQKNWTVQSTQEEGGVEVVEETTTQRYEAETAVRTSEIVEKYTTTKPSKEEKMPKKEMTKEKEELPSFGQVPELELLKDILPWIPHVLRRHHRVHKPRPTTMAPKETLHLEDILRGGDTSLDEADFGVDNVTKSGGMTNLTRKMEQEFNMTSTEIPIMESDATTENVTTTTEPPLEPINEEELALNLHQDSLHRTESELRQMLTLNATSERRNGSETFRDLGGSFILPLLKELKYDNKSIPLVFPDEPLKVTISLEVLHLGNFDNFQMEYELDVLFHLQWFDVRLANNFTKPVRIKEQQIIDKIWKPDAMFFNSKYSFFHIVSFPNFRMRIEPNGQITYTSRVTLLPDCQMNFCNFPHDIQRCGLLISSIAHPKSMLEFLWDRQQPIVFSKKITLPDLRIKKIGTEECQIGGKLIPSSCLTLSFLLHRDSARYIAEKYLPSTLAMIFSWVAPYVPYNYEEVRIITPITVLLTLVQMEKGNQEVITSYLTSLDIWFVVIKAFTVLSLIESLTVMAYIKRGRAVEKQAQRAANEYQKDLLQGEAKRIVRVYHRLDHFSRVFFPVAFVCFLMFYMAFIAQRNEQQCQEQAIDLDNLEAII